MPVYRRITTAERLAAYKSGIFELDSRDPFAPYLKGWYRLGAFGGVHEEDYSIAGGKNHGVRTNGPTKKASHNPIKGPLDALDFDGTGDYVDVGDKETLDLTSALTIALWAKLDTKDAVKTFVSKGTGGQSDHAWDIKYHTPADTIRSSLRASSGQTNVDGTTSPVLGEWFHAAVTWDGSTAKIYFNGLQDGNDTAFTGPIQTNTRVVGIGDGTGTISAPHDGQIDDVRIYNIALPESYIRRELHLNAGLNSVRPPVFRVYSFPAAGGPTTVQLGQAVDTSSAFAVSPKRTLTLGQAIDTQSAFSATARRDLVVGQAVSAETARAVTVSRAVSLQQAAETDTSFSATVRRTTSLGLASESDQAFAVQALRTLALGRADETDSAFGVTVVTGADIAVGQAVETDTAPSTTVQRTVSVGQAVETDAAPAATPVRTLTVGQAIETVTAFAVTPERGLTVGIATETDTAFGTGVLTTVTLGQAVETDTAFSVTALGAGQIQVGLAVETDTAFGLTIIVTAQFVGPYRPRRPDLVSSYQPRRPDSGSDYRARRPDEEVQ